MGFGLPPEGTRRLTLVIEVAAAAACLLLFAFAIGLRGLPYWQGWWAVIAAILVAAIAGARALAFLIEWIVKGYDAPR